ncbi:hypothetical protein EON65_54865 [archaeon]|nr:MAG: hypothetical protein EON65_54865 [archaeon]
MNNRIESLSSLHTKQRLQLAQIWNKREAFRYECSSKNTALNYLLKRASDARGVCRDNEEKERIEREKLEAKNKKKK